jgi:hypothetical protein
MSDDDLCFEEWPDGEYDNPIRHPWLGEVHLAAIRFRGYAMPHETEGLVAAVERAAELQESLNSANAYAVELYEQGAALVARVRELEAALSAAIDTLAERQFVAGEEDEFNDDEVIAAVAAARAVLGECHCGGRGWTPEVDADGYSTGRERYCGCPAGERRKAQETP